MFIKSGDHVNIIGGSWAGRVGIVRRILIDDTAGEVLVEVDSIMPNGWEYEFGFVRPIELKRRKLSPVAAERLSMMHEAHLAEEQEKRAA